MLKAFMAIRDEEARALILKMVEAAARGATVRSVPYPAEAVPADAKLH